MTLKIDEKRVLDCISAPILVIDRSFKIVFMNDAARIHHGDDSALIGRSCFDATHGLDHPCWEDNDVDCPVRSVFESGRRQRTFHKHPHDGQLIVEEIIATPLGDEGSDVEFVLEEFRDVTELLELREGILPICSHCKRIRGPEGQWHVLEAYFCRHTGADFSHSLCPECLKEHYPIFDESEDPVRE